MSNLIDIKTTHGLDRTISISASENEAEIFMTQLPGTDKSAKNYSLDTTKLSGKKLLQRLNLLHFLLTLTLILCCISLINQINLNHPLQKEMKNKIEMINQTQVTNVKTISKNLSSLERKMKDIEDYNSTTDTRLIKLWNITEILKNTISNTRQKFLLFEQSKLNLDKLIQARLEKLDQDIEKLGFEFSSQKTRRLQPFCQNLIQKDFVDLQANLILGTSKMFDSWRFSFEVLIDEFVSPNNKPNVMFNRLVQVRNIQNNQTRSPSVLIKSNGYYNYKFWDCDNQALPYLSYGRYDFEKIPKNLTENQDLMISTQEKLSEPMAIRKSKPKVKNENEGEVTMVPQTWSCHYAWAS